MPKLSELQEVLDKSVARHRVPGVSAGVLFGGRELVAHAGVTSLEDPLQVNDRTLFQIGSTSKTFTATAVMRLVEAGAIDLDEHVSKYLPDFRVKSRKATRALTVRHLLTHTGGWDGDSGADTDTGWGDDALRRFVASLKRQRQLTPAGAVWSYNNTGFCVAARIAEVVTGKPFETVVREEVLVPLGLNDTFFFPIEVLSRRFAPGHSVVGPRTRVAHSWGLTRAIAAAGGVVSSARDQLAWARFHMGDGRAASGRRVLKRPTLREMQRAQAPAGCFADQIGLSWLLTDRDGHRIVAHGGNVSNISLSSFAMVPARGFAVTVLTNSANGRLVHDDVERWALEAFLGIRELEPETMDVSPAELRAYAGSYSSALQVVEVTLEGRRLKLASRYNIDPEDYPEEDRAEIKELLAHPPKPLMVGLAAPDVAVVVSGPGKGTRGEFLRDGKRGEVAWLRWGGRLARRDR